MAFFIVLLLILGLLVWYGRTFLSLKKKVDWSSSLVYPSFFGIAITLALIGYHVGIYSHLHIFSSEFRLPATGWAIATVFFAIAWAIILQRKMNLLVVSLLVPFALGGIMQVLTANGFVQSFDIAVQFVCSAGLLIILLFDTFHWTAEYVIRTLGFLLPAGTLQAVRIIRSFFVGHPEKKLRIGAWIKTVIIVCGVLVIFMWILSEADPIFAEVIREFRSQLAGRTISTILILLIASSFATISFRPDENNNNQWITLRDIAAAVGALTILLAVFLFIQFKYIFLGSTDLLTQLNLSFSEYVRKGFTELLIATGIGGICSYILTLRVRKEPEHRMNTLAIISNLVLIVELGLILASAFKRDLLYVDTYGLTRVRIVGGLFLLWLAGFLSALGIFASRKTLRESKLLLTIWIISLGVWCGINIINIDKKVMAGSPGHHLYTDYFYLSQLSEDVQNEKTQMLKKMENEINTLTLKSELTDIEEYQLAGLKLALITLVEKRNRLYLYYAPDEWLLTNGWKIGKQFDTDIDDNQWQYQTTLIYELTTATGWKDEKISKRIIPRSLQNIRKMVFYNRRERAAYELLATQEYLYFDTINELYQQIRSYQIQNQISLAEEENKLLYEFRYPFLNVNLKTFSPEDLNRVFVPSADQIDTKYKEKNKELIQFENTNNPTLSEINKYNCTSAPIQTEIYATLLNYKSNTTSGMTATLRPLVTGEPLVGVFIPSSVKLRPPDFVAKREQSAKQNPRKQSDVFAPSFQQSPSSIDVNNSIFVRMQLESNKVIDSSSGGCYMRPRATDIQEIYSFPNL